MPNMSVEGNRLIVRAPFAMKNDIKAIPSRAWDETLKAWTFPATGQAARQVHKEFVKRCLTVTMDWHAQELQMRGNRMAFNSSSLEHKFKTEPFSYQRTGLAWAASSDASYLAHVMGAGKTKIVIDLLDNLPGHKLALVVCPQSVGAVWPYQYEKHGSGRYTILNLCQGTLPKRAASLLAQIKNQFADKFTAINGLIVLVNYEGAWRDPLRDLLLETPWDVVVADELQRAKSWKGKAGKFMVELGAANRRPGCYRIGLSGTPMPHGPLDLFNQCKFLDPAVFGESYFAFKQRYCVLGGFQGKEVKGYKNLDELRSRFALLAHTVTENDLNELPPTRHIPLPVALGPKALKAYNDLDENFCTEVAGGFVTATNALARIIRLQQVTSGYTKTEDGVEHIIGDEKKVALIDLLDGIDPHEPVVVFCLFHHELEVIKAAASEAGRPARELSGRLNQLSEWQNAPTELGSVLAVQVRAGSLGVDMTIARKVIFMSQTWSLGDYEQALKRSHRTGQDKPVTYWHLLVQNSIDVEVYEALQAKDDVVVRVIDKRRVQLKGVLDVGNARPDGQLQRAADSVPESVG